MTLCAFCGYSTLGSPGLCSHHALSDGNGWAVSNRIMCDFVHRGIVPPTPGDLPIDELEETLLA